MAKAPKTDKRSCVRRGGCAHLKSKACLTTCPHKPIWSSKKWKSISGKKCGKKVLSSKKFKVASTCKKTKPKKSCCSR